jgi:ABC-2 type transport system ATP-binding protein
VRRRFDTATEISQPAVFLTLVTGSAPPLSLASGLVSPAIEVTDLALSYGELRAVDGVSFEVAEGEFFGILGPNGAGKTTTLELVEGLRKPDAGEITVLGQRPWPRNPRILPRIGVQLQASSFFDRLTAREQIHTFAAMYGVGTGPADEWLGRVGLEDKASTRVEKLSGGQVQRLSIACALVHDPEIVFLDEPTAALDPQARRNLWDLLSGLTESGRTVVLTTHYMDEAEALCERVAIMDHGALLRLDTPAALVRGLDAPTRVTVATGQLSLAEGLGLTGVDAAEEVAAGLVLTTREPAAVLALLAEREALGGVQVRTSTLEDVFLDLTGREYRA